MLEEMYFHHAKFQVNILGEKNCSLTFGALIDDLRFFKDKGETEMDKWCLLKAGLTDQ